MSLLNLIRRDFIVQKFQLYFLIPLLIFFIILDVPHVLTYLVAGIYIPYNALAYDEQAETHLLLNSLPYTRKEIIAARYIGAIVYMVIAIILVTIILFLFNRPISLTNIAISFGLFILFVAFTLPFYYFFKVGNISLFIIIGFIVCSVAASALFDYFFAKYPSFAVAINNIPVNLLYKSVFIIIIFFYALSWLLTLFIYERRSL